MQHRPADSQETASRHQIPVNTHRPITDQSCDRQPTPVNTSTNHRSHTMALNTATHVFQVTTASTANYRALMIDTLGILLQTLYKFFFRHFCDRAPQHVETIMLSVFSPFLDHPVYSQKVDYLLSDYKPLENARRMSDRQADSDQ